MGKKYLDTKEGSLEQSILGLWEKAAVKQEKLVGGQKKLDKDKDGDIDGKDFAMLRKSKKKEEVELDEAPAKVWHLANKKFNLISDKGGYILVKQGSGEEKRLKAKTPADATAELVKKGYREEVQVKEGKMSQLHQHIKDGKTAEEIAKIMKVDAKTIKKLMAGYNESYEIGTDGYRKHTENVTPGEDGEWVAAQKSKNDSMREALAKVWNATEDKNPFKKDLTKEVKNGKTMTGKKVASVDINPKIMEKKK